MKHVGKMKNNGARVVTVFRTLPGDPHSALVVGTNGLADSYHDALMSLIESESGQQAYELADILAVRKFPDGNTMLEWLHNRGMLKKVPTNGVLMTPNPSTMIPLDELNTLIADQQGVSLEDLSIKPDEAKEEIVVSEATAEKKTKWDKAREEKAEAAKETESTKLELSPAEMRSRADALYKEAARLRKEADSLDPPKKKSVKVEATEA
jgi:hypothetical protein